MCIQILLEFGITNIYMYLCPQINGIYNNDMEEKEKELILDVFVNRCIDNIIKHEIIEGVNDQNSFASYFRQLEPNDDSIIEAIGRGAEISYREMSDVEKKRLETLSCNLLYMTDYPIVGVTRKYYRIEEWSAYLLTLVHSRIRLILRQNIVEQ